MAELILVGAICGAFSLGVCLMGFVLKRPPSRNQTHDAMELLNRLPTGEFANVVGNLVVDLLDRKDLRSEDIAPISHVLEMTRQSGG